MSDQLIHDMETETKNFLDTFIEKRGVIKTKGSAYIQQYPVFIIDAPWRIEQGIDDGKTVIPLTFILRDAIGLEIETISVSYSFSTNARQKRERKCFVSKILKRTWKHLIDFPIHAKVNKRYWTYPEDGEAEKDFLSIPISKLKNVENGDDVYLRFKLIGSEKFPEKVLKIFIASNPLPYSRNKNWLYGDTHYHSSYTNDIKEFGNPLADTARAARCIGLDWMIITDHSCDVIDNNPYIHDQPIKASQIWQEFNQKVDEINKAYKGSFHFIPGQEVSVIGSDSNQIHLLVFRDKPHTFIPGAWSDKKEFWDKYKKKKQFFLSKDQIQMLDHLFGTIHTLDQVLNKPKKTAKNSISKTVCEQKLLAFAAHPTTAPLDWSSDDIDLLLDTCGKNGCGLEAWNSNYKKTSKNEDNPNKKWIENKKNPKQIEDGVELWEKYLQKIIDEKKSMQFPLLGGSDAHGSFNFSIDWGIDFKEFDYFVVHDNCLGKVRTLIDVRDRKGKTPTIKDITTAIRKGKCIVTDGPVVDFQLAFNNTVSRIGDVLDIDKNGDLIMSVHAESNQEEFGDIKEFTLHYYFEEFDRPKELLIPYKVQKGALKTTPVEIPKGRGYFRLSLQTQRTFKDKKLKFEEKFFSFTNPIWIRSSIPGQKLKIYCKNRLD